jgi:hypothetical protein
MFPAGDNFKTYEPRLVSKDINPSTATGRKVFEQVVIPKSDQVKELPALSFSYFNPLTHQYETITRGPFPLTVHFSSNAAARLVQAMSDHQLPTTVLLGNDIIYLKPAPAAWQLAGQRPWFTRTSFLALQMLPLAAAFGVFFMTRRRQSLALDVARARRQQAPKGARAALRKAGEALTRGDRVQFYEAIWEALATYFGHRLNLAPGEVSCAAVMQAMRRGGLDAGIHSELETLFADCDRERFAAGAGGSPLDKAAAEELLDKLTRGLKACEKVRI